MSLILKVLSRWTTDGSSINTRFYGGGVMFTSISGDEQAILESFVAAEVKRLKQYDKRAKVTLDEYSAMVPLKVRQEYSFLNSLINF